MSMFTTRFESMSQNTASTAAGTASHSSLDQEPGDRAAASLGPGAGSARTIRT